MHDDRHLYLRWLQSADEAAFATLARRHAALVADVAFQVRGDRGVAEDALQEALLTLACDGTRRPAEVGVRAWLARAAISKARNAMASKRARTRREQIVGAARAETAMDADRDAAKQDAAATLTGLGGEDAALLSMRFIHELGYGELAAVLGVAEATARVRVHRALVRARGAARRDDLDDKAFGALLAGVPAFSLPGEAVDTAVDRALRRAGPATSTGVGLQARGTPRWVVPAVSALLLAGLTVVAWRALDEDGAVDDARQTATTPRDGPTLRGRTPPTHAAGETTPGRPPKGAAVPGARRKLPHPPGHVSEARAPVPEPVQTALRLELLLADGARQQIEISRVWHKGYEFTGKDLGEHPELLRTRPGEVVTLATEDERAAMASVRVRVPDPVPPLITVALPSKGDERLQRLELLVVDQVTGRPLPEAVLHWGEDALRATTQAADAYGRIVVTSPPGEPTQPALWHFANAERYVHAPGYQGVGWAFGTKEFVPSIDFSALASWLESGTQRISLRPLHDAPGLEERALQLLDAEGSPVADAYMYVAYPTKGYYRPLHDGGRLDAGFLRTDDAGIVRFPMRDVVGVELRKHRVLLAAWKLAKEAWPGSGPRILRLPPIANAELTIEGLPDGVACSWTRDPLGPKRQPADGPVLVPTVDAAAERYLEAHEAALPICHLDHASGTLVAPHATIRLDLVAGRTHTLYVQVGAERRTWKVKPSGAGPLKLARAWDDLEKTER